MIPDLQMSVLCDDVRQERSGKFILIGLFDVIGMASFPALFGRICIVNRWCCGQGQFMERTRIVGPDNGPVVAEGKGIPVQLQSPEATATNVEFFMNVKFESEGVYWVEIIAVPLAGQQSYRNEASGRRAAPGSLRQVNHGAVAHSSASGGKMRSDD